MPYCNEILRVNENDLAYTPWSAKEVKDGYDLGRLRDDTDFLLFG